MWISQICVVSSVLLASLVASDSDLRGRRGRQQAAEETSVPGGVDFAGCEMQPDGMCCVLKESEIKTIAKDPILECTHKEVEKCHYTYVTEFTPAQEEVCEENFEKKCQITFKQMAVKETVKKCYRPLIKKCGKDADLRLKKRQLPTYGPDQVADESLAQGQQVAGEECKTFYESACTTKYIEKQPGKFVGDTSCEKLPIELCGKGCMVEEGEEECHDKEIESLLDVPEEHCDLNPQKTCRFQTKLVPSLKPTHECTIIPQEICQLKFTSPREESKPLMSKWCIDPAAEVTPDQTYDENEAAAPPLGPEQDTGKRPQPSQDAPINSAPINNAPLKPDTLYGAPGAGPDTSSADLGEENVPPPPPAPRASFEQAESSNTYETPSQGRENQPRGQNGGGGPRKNNGPGRKNGGGGRRKPGAGAPAGGRNAGGPISTLYGAPVAEASAPLASYGFADELPSYGTRRRVRASNMVPVYIPGAQRAHYIYY